MAAEIYTLTLRADERYGREAERQGLRDRLGRIPGMQRLEDDRHRFGEPDEHGVMEIEMRREGEVEDPERTNRIEVRIPRPWVMERGPQVFAVVFMMAEWCGFEVHDPQIGDTLQKDAVLQGLVAMRQRRLESEGRGGPPGTQAHFLDPPDERG